MDKFGRQKLYCSIDRNMKISHLLNICEISLLWYLLTHPSTNFQKKCPQTMVCF